MLPYECKICSKNEQKRAKTSKNEQIQGLATNSAPALYFYHPDHLGSTAMVTDLDGHITQNVVYIPYGEVFVEERNGSWASSYLFNAKELDEETGLYYYGARYLNPSIALWLSTDPLQGKYPGMSPYNYCAGNPVKLVDPDGMVVWVIPVIGKAFEFLIAGSLIVAYKNYLTKRNEDEKNNDNSHYHESRGKNQNNQSTKSGQSSGTNTSSGKELKNSDKIKEGKDFEAKELANARKKGFVTNKIGSKKWERKCQRKSYKCRSIDKKRRYK